MTLPGKVQEAVDTLERSGRWETVVAEEFSANFWRVSGERDATNLAQTKITVFISTSRSARGRFAGGEIRSIGNSEIKLPTWSKFEFWSRI